MEELRSSKGFYLMLGHGHVDNKIPQYRCLPGLRESLKANKVSGVEVQKETAASTTGEAPPPAGCQV